MNKVYLLLVIIILGTMFSISGYSQSKSFNYVKGLDIETKQIMNSPEVLSFQSSLRSDTESWPDSVIYFNSLGDRTSKYVYTYLEEGGEKRTDYTWENEEWVDQGTFYMGKSYGFVGKVDYFVSEWEEDPHVAFILPFGYDEELMYYFKYPNATREDCKPKYDINNNLISFQLANSVLFTINYNNENKPVSILLQYIDEKEPYDYWKAEYTYNQNNDNLLCSIYYMNYGVWQKDEETINEYDEKGLRLSRTRYTLNDETEKFGPYLKNVYKNDDKGRRAIQQDFMWMDDVNNWILTGYNINYPNSLESEFQAGDATAVSTDNKGFIEVGLTLPSDQIINISYVATFPYGILLNKDETKLSTKLSASHTLTLTPLSERKWLIEIKTKGTKSVLRAHSEIKIMDIAFTVDEELKQGNYDAFLGNLLIEMNDGSLITEDRLTVPIEVRRFGVDNQNISTGITDVRVKGNTLFISTEYSEFISVYDLNGKLVYSVSKEAGEISFQLKTLPRILILKGSSGWAEKIFIKND